MTRGYKIMEAQRDGWLLTPPEPHNTFITQPDQETIERTGRFASDIGVLVHHPRAPMHHDRPPDIVICNSGWTEAKLDTQAQAIARIGIAAASFNHPRQGALRDLVYILQASRRLRSNWRELSSALLDERDLDLAESIFIDIMNEQTGDKDTSKTLLSGAISAGKYRRDNLVAVTETFREADYNVHLLGHSLGGIDATLATKAVPKGYVGSLILAGPGGLMMQDSPERIIPRIASTVVSERQEMFRNTRELARMAINTVFFISKNPILTLYEGGYAATSRLEKPLWDIMADKGVPSVLILGGKDKMFPTDVVSMDTRYIPFAGRIVLLDAGHNMTSHQTADVAIVVHNTVTDSNNHYCSILETNMKNALAQRRSQRPQNMFTVVDMEDDLFSR